MNEYRNKYPNRAKANMALNTAIRHNKIKKPLFCEVCQKETKLHGHHNNYQDYLQVLWVCPQCHKNIHHPNKKIYIKKSVYKPHHKKFQPAPKRDMLLLHAKELKALGKSYGQISKEINISKGTIYKWLNEVSYD